MKLKEWLKPLNVKSCRIDTRLEIRASLDESTCEVIWDGAFEDFIKDNPKVAWKCRLCGTKISDLLVGDALVDDGEEDSLTITVKAADEKDLYDTDRF